MLLSPSDSATPIRATTVHIGGGIGHRATLLLSLSSMSFMKAVAVVLLLTAQVCDAQTSNSSSGDVVVDVNTWYDTFKQGPPFVVTSLVGAYVESKLEIGSP